jgi:replicative DNA helicase
MIQIAKTTRGILTGKRYEKYSEIEKSLINQAVNAYGNYADHVYIFEGTGDIGVEQIKQNVLQHIKLTNRLPIVIIDYIQIMAPYNIYLNDKQNMDKNVMELKRLSRDCKIPIIGISSFNRASYKEDVSMSAFKESGAIEYSSDVLIGLHTKKDSRNSAIDKTSITRDIVVSVLKNRNGAVGELSYEYFAYYNYFREM